MRVLVHMQTINDMDVIRASVAAVMAQTRPVDGARDAATTYLAASRTITADVRTL